MRAFLLTGSILLLLASSARAQQAQGSGLETSYVPSFRFDVASIRESQKANSYSVTMFNPEHASSIKLNNVDVEDLLEEAYGVEYAQIKGLPDWTSVLIFNVQAKSDEATDAQLAKLKNKEAQLEKQHMLQVLLADRFKFKSHWETHEGQIYELVVAKGGSKLCAAGSLPPRTDELEHFHGKKPPKLYQQGDGIRGYEFVGHGCSVARLALTLTGQMGTPVVDKTGLAGDYDFVLQYRGAVADETGDNPATWPPLMSAVPDQLGLRLQRAKGMKTFLVVDNIEKPSEN